MLLSCICLLANPSEESHKVFGQCIDNFTTNPVDTGTVVLMSQDNVPLDTVSLSKTSKGRFSFTVNKVGSYGVKVYSNNYETVYQAFEVRSKREEFVYVKTIRMEKKAILLEDVVVKASKIKMVFMGDTIVYNSDAFNLADGSMLQDLIKELPGASINDNGQIYINGRFVQSLMINGKDFFGGNPMVALQNLPAYTVSKIKVFDQEGRNTHMMKRNMGDNQYTMDVKLKKEYSKGYMGNLEAGIGTDSRYRIKGFGMRSTEVSDLIGFISMNNLNETSSASSGGRWRNFADVKGLKDIKSVGLSYQNTFNKITRSWYGNSLIYTYTDDNLLEKMNRQTFYETGDMYSKSTSENQTKLHDVTYTGNLEIGGTAFTMMGDVKAKYTNKKRNGSYNLESMHNTKLLNTMNSLDQGEERYYFFDTRLQGGIKHISDMIGYNFNVNYDNLNSTGFNMHNINYQASSRDYLHRYMEMPNHHFHINSYIDYNYHLKLIDIIPNYNFTYEHGNTKNALYRLDKISTVDSTLLNMLPSAVDELNQVIDSVNTYRYTDQLLSHYLGIEFKWRPSFLGNRGELNFQPRVVIIHKDINYFRKKDYNLTVNNVFFFAKYLCF